MLHFKMHPKNLSMHLTSVKSIIENCIVVCTDYTNFSQKSWCVLDCVHLYVYDSPSKLD